jgi:hypothetical protein
VEVGSAERKVKWGQTVAGVGTARGAGQGAAILAESREGPQAGGTARIKALRPDQGLHHCPCPHSDQNNFIC